MLDTPNSRNIQDFKQRYQGVCGWLHTTEAPRVAVFVRHVSSSKVTFQDQRGNEYYANVDGGAQFEFVPTQRAWYNAEDATYLVQRVPARQWKRGICADNTSFSCLHPGDTLMPAALNETWEQTAFKVMSANMNVTTAVEQFRAKKRTSVAISKHFAVGECSAWFINLRIGKVDKNKIMLEESYHMIAQELLDAIKRNNLPFEVLV